MQTERRSKDNSVETAPVLELPVFTPYPEFREIQQISTRNLVLQEVASKKNELVKILDRPVRVDAFEERNNTIFSAQLTDTFLQGDNLLKLMLATCPNFGWWEGYDCYRDIETMKLRSGQGRSGVIYDWKIVEAANDQQIGLVTLHAAQMREFWDEFVGSHLSQFRDAVKAPAKGEYEEYFHCKIDIEKFASRSFAIRNLPELLGKIRYKAHHDVLAKFLKEHLDIYGDELDDDFNIETIGTWDLSEAEFVSKLSEESRAALVDAGILNDLIFVVDTEREPYVIFENEYPSSNVVGKAEYLGDDRIEVSLGEGSAVFELNGFESDNLITSIPDDYSKALQPVLVWAKDTQTGKRQYLNGELPKAIGDSLDRRSNTLLGLLVALYLSDDVRKSLPREIRFGRFPQKMAEAQMPLLASVFRGKILEESQIFEELERLAA